MTLAADNYRLNAIRHVAGASLVFVLGLLTEYCFVRLYKEIGDLHKSLSPVAVERATHNHLITQPPVTLNGIRSTEFKSDKGLEMLVPAANNSSATLST